MKSSLQYPRAFGKTAGERVKICNSIFAIFDPPGVHRGLLYKGEPRKLICRTDSM
jgi:hypothetical protein